ncbi:MAG: hypothetical protein ACOYYS_27655 [Chloroflexota bacterium]
MLQINILFPKNPGIYECFLTPLLVNRRRLNDNGIRFRIFSNDDDAFYDADIVIVFSNILRGWGCSGVSGEDVTLKAIHLLERVKQRAGCVFWFDVSDSTGSNQFQYLPYVDKFLKAYLLKDVTAYQQQYYRDRIYTDYYHQHFNILEEKAPPLRILPSQTDLPKIQLGWSSALGDFGWAAPYLRQARRYLPLPNFYTARFANPARTRNVPINMRFSAHYNRATIAYQRQQLAEKASQLGVSMGRIPRNEYLRELRRSRVAVSPFGWGEVCFRDYEIMLSGSALIKPDVSHMNTWPNLYLPDQTYLPIQWDLSDFQAELNSALMNDIWIEIASQAQSVYRKYLFEEEGRLAFCEHFLRSLNLS